MRKQLLRVRLLYKIKAIEDTVKHQEEFSNVSKVSVESFVCNNGAG